jgi:hypothetical protein
MGLRVDMALDFEYCLGHGPIVVGVVYIIAS